MMTMIATRETNEQLARANRHSFSSIRTLDRDCLCSPPRSITVSIARPPATVLVAKSRVTAASFIYRTVLMPRRNINQRRWSAAGREEKKKKQVISSHENNCRPVIIFVISCPDYPRDINRSRDVDSLIETAASRILPTRNSRFEPVLCLYLYRSFSAVYSSKGLQLYFYRERLSFPLFPLCPLR